MFRHKRNIIFLMYLEHIKNNSINIFSKKQMNCDKTSETKCFFYFYYGFIHTCSFSEIKPNNRQQFPNATIFISALQ